MRPVVLYLWMVLLVPFNEVYSQSTSSDTTYPEELDLALKKLYTKHALGLRFGQPSEREPLIIATRGFFGRHWLDQLYFGMVATAGEVEVTRWRVNGSDGYNYSIGPTFFVPIEGSKGRLKGVLQAKFHWLARYRFDDKEYGGPIHWSYALGANAQLGHNTFVEYLWRHISNGDRYPENPSLETHNLGFGINF